MPNFLTIDSNLRTITIPQSVTNIGVEADDDVLRLHFKIPRYYGEFDLYKFKIRINYENAEGNGDVYAVTDVKVVDENHLTFSWLVGRFATMSKGDVRFVVCLRQVDEDGTVVREFNTTTASSPILEGLETSEAVYQQYPDVLEHVLLRVNEFNLVNGSTEGSLRAVGAAEETDEYTMGEGAFAVGRGSKASGADSVAAGQGVTAIGRGAHAEGIMCEARGEGAHAEGSGTQTKAGNSHAEGLDTIAGSPEQHVQGKYNEVDTGYRYAHIVGNGTADNNRSNAHTLDWNGNAWFRGDVYVGDIGQFYAEKLVRKSELDAAIAEVSASGGAGITLYSPNGTQYTISVDDSGNLNATKN